MRFIDLEELKHRISHLLPALEEAGRQVALEPDEQRRSELIAKFRPKWVAFRQEFSRFSHGKCWYIECKNPGTDDDIDHFRPKSQYYWLAFEWTNFRLSCHRANRPRTNPSTGETGGKADHFPLVYPEDRALTPQDDLRMELPALLDPTNVVDTTLLTFTPDGAACLAPDHKGDPVAELRFECTRLYLHLNWPEFQDARTMLYNKIARTVARGSREAPFGPKGIHVATAAFYDAAIDLRRFMDPREEYSMAARAYIESFGHVWWVRKIVLRA